MKVVARAVVISVDGAGDDEGHGSADGEQRIEGGEDEDRNDDDDASLLFVVYFVCCCRNNAVHWDCEENTINGYNNAGIQKTKKINN